MATATKTKKKRKYNYITKEALEKGQEWKINLPLDADVALKLYEEHEKNPGGGEFVRLINARLRKSYGLKK